MTIKKLYAINLILLIVIILLGCTEKREEKKTIDVSNLEKSTYIIIDGELYRD